MTHNLAKNDCTDSLPFECDASFRLYMNDSATSTLVKLFVSDNQKLSAMEFQSFIDCSAFEIVCLISCQIELVH